MILATATTPPNFDESLHLAPIKFPKARKRRRVYPSYPLYYNNTVPRRRGQIAPSSYASTEKQSPTTASSKAVSVSSSASKASTSEPPQPQPPIILVSNRPRWKPYKRWRW